MEDVPPSSSYSQEIDFQQTERGSGTNKKDIEVQKGIKVRNMSSILNRGRVAKTRYSKIKSSERAQIFVDLANAKKELVDLMKEKILEKNELEVQVLRVQLEKEKVQLEKEKLQLQLLRQQAGE